MILGDRAGLHNIITGSSSGKSRLLMLITINLFTARQLTCYRR
ncbi:hypothetical protein EPIR_3041 [Erwinia piriflorinigrans CFBP 5888]|uniref:Uncharacterized protein n=1 Tax=Erwinia piriflorinigrans CFBP 5888 TaxID=1161919 RepID=V5ZBV2_9GAMM|nr:hypothetical protein EPIR_3041 [Erwinia piriflorinigrans CFBP 5888]